MDRNDHRHNRAPDEEICHGTDRYFDSADAAGFTLERSSVDLRDLVDETVREFAGLFEGSEVRVETRLEPTHAWVDRVITFDRNGPHRGIRGRLRLAAELRKQAFDTVIILPNSFDSALVPWLAG